MSSENNFCEVFLFQLSLRLGFSSSFHLKNQLEQAKSTCLVEQESVIVYDGILS